MKGLPSARKAAGMTQAEFAAIIGVDRSTVTKWERGRASEIYYIAGFSYEHVIEILDNIPAADVAPVVRCKDCKWFANNNGSEWFGCWLFNAIRAVPEDSPTPDDFCSYGERKTVR